MEPKNLEIEPQSNATSPLQQVATNIRESWNRLHRWVFPLLVFAAILTIAFFASKQKDTNQIASIKKEPDYLAVVAVSPQDNTDTTRPEIYIRFNMPVSAHHAEEYFYLEPYVKGTLEQYNENEIVYRPLEDFKPGMHVSFSMKEGFPSESGKRLGTTYARGFTIRPSFTGIQFANNEWIGKFMSFATDKGADITFKVEDTQNPKVSVYKADIATVLNSLVYTVPENRSYEPYYPESYKETFVDTSKLKLIKEYTDVKDGDKVNFKDQTGVYLFQGTDDRGVPSNAWVTLNQTGIHFRQDDKKVYLAAQDLVTGAPVGGLDLTFYQLGDTPKRLAQHTLGNIQEYPFSFDQRLDIVVAKKGNDTLIIPVKIPNSQAEIKSFTDLDKKNVIFVYTDRPIYKKGAKVAFRGVIRNDNDGVYKPSNVSKIKITADNYNSWKYEKEVSVNPGGVFSGEFILPSDIQVGTVTVSASVPDGTAGSLGYSNTSFDVFEYTKPAYELLVATDTSDYTKPDPMKITVSGKLFTGKALANQRVAYTVYKKDYYETEKAVYNSAFNITSWGGMCGGGSFEEYYGSPLGESKDVTLDAGGKAEITFDTKDLDSSVSQEITVVVEKTDENGNKIIGAKRAIVHQGSFNIFFRPGPTQVQLGNDFSTIFYAEDRDGEKLANKTFVYELSRSTYENGQSTQTVIRTGAAKTDENGTGIIKEKVTGEEPVYINLSVMTLDDNGNKIVAYRGINFYENGDTNFNRWSTSIGQTILQMTSSKNSFVVGETAHLSIVAPDDMTVFASFERGRVYDEKWVHLTKGENSFDFEVPDYYAPSITPTFSFFYQGQYHIEGLSLNVPAMHKLLDVSVSTDKEKYNPGDTAIITVTTRDASGNLISADVGMGIVDKAIFALRKNAAGPLHSSFYFYRPRSTNSSSSLSWIATNDWGGSGGGGGGMDSLMKDSDTSYWNPNLKTGSDGQVKVTIPVGKTQTTWVTLVYASTDDTKLGQATKDFLVAQ